MADTLSFMDMLLLTLKNHRQPSPFTPQIMLAIFWEESLFRNIPQIGGGKGVGFGQVERQNFFFLTTPRAQQLGYAVPGVTTNTTTLDDARSVQVASCVLLHLFHHPDAARSADRKEFAYQGYAGVKAAAGTSLSAAQRRAIIGNWKACEADLLTLPFSEFTIINFPGLIQTLEARFIAALRKAKEFDEKTPVTRMRNGTPETVTLREVLFPRYWFFPAADQLALSTFLPAGTFLQQGSQGGQVRLLQKMLNAQPAPPVPSLAADGQFGSKTRAAVQGFQAAHALVPDGVVGPKTRAALV
jgi:hypothetical protein